MGSSALTSAVALAAAVIFTNQAIAEPLSGIWSSPYGCEWLEQNAHNTDLATEDSRIYSIGYLDNTGVNGVNWGCSFNSITTDNTGTFTADSNCWMETKFWKQNIAVTKNAETWIVVIHEDHDEKIYLVFDTQCVVTSTK